MHSISSNSCVVETAFRIQQPNNFTLFKQSNTRPRSVFLSRSTAVLRCVLNAFLPPLNRRCKSNTRCLCRSSCRSRHTVYPGRDGTRTSICFLKRHTHQCNVTRPLKNLTFTGATCIDSMAAANRHDSNASPCNEYRVSC